MGLRIMANLFDGKFISELPDDNIEAWHKIYSKYKQIVKEMRHSVRDTEELYDKYLDIYGFIISMLDIRPIGVSLQPPSFNRSEDITRIEKILITIGQQVGTELKKRHDREVFADAIDRYPTMIPGGFTYEFLETDYKRIQELINELRTLTSESKQIERNHKRRLLKRIEKLQQELNKKMSNLDVFWGLFGEAGVNLGKFGKDIKPLTDRVCEILKIVARTQARASGLPSGKETPLLRAVNDVTEQNEGNDK